MIINYCEPFRTTSLVISNFLTKKHFDDLRVAGGGGDGERGPRVVVLGVDVLDKLSEHIVEKILLIKIINKCFTFIIAYAFK